MRHRLPGSARTILVALCAAACGNVAGAGTPWALSHASDGLLPTGNVLEAPIDVDPTVADLRDGDTITLPVPGHAIEGTVARRRATHATRYTLSGSLDAAHGGGSFVIAVNGDRMAAVIRSGSAGTWEAGSDLTGAHHVERFDENAPLGCTTADVQPPIAPASPAIAGGPCGDGTVVDVLIIMTSGAVDDAGGINGAIAIADLSIEDANTALTNSGVNTQLNLVYMQRVFVQDAVATLGALTNPSDGVLDEVHTLRDAYGADEVVLIYGGGGGVANGLAGIDPVLERLAFCRAGLASTASMVVAHESDQILGACHALGDGGGCGIGLLFDFSNGHRFQGDGGPQWRTVMAYPPGVLAPYYSSPNVIWDGQPTGLPIDALPYGADNVRTFAVSTYLVSNFRCNDTICESLGLAPDAPDCDASGVPDGCEIALGWSEDLNGNGTPDTCECLSDVDGSGSVGFSDLLRIFAAWGTTCAGCPEDTDFNGSVGGSDVLRVIESWGSCE